MGVALYHSGMRVEPAAAPRDVRLDVWLDVACLFRTRSEAQKACRTGKVDVNGVTAKPHRDVRAGDTVRIARPLGRTQIVVVRGLAERHVAKAEARGLYEDVTPPPTADEIAMRRMERVFRATVAPKQRPDKRDRRALRGLKEG
jgi:ribosome-associated heat shock protein Hsp15